MAELNPTPARADRCETCAAFTGAKYHAPRQVTGRVLQADGTVQEQPVETTAFVDRRGVCHRHPVAVAKDLIDWCLDHLPQKGAPR